MPLQRRCAAVTVQSPYLRFSYASRDSGKSVLPTSITAPSAHSSEVFCESGRQKGRVPVSSAMPCCSSFAHADAALSPAGYIRVTPERSTSAGGAGSVTVSELTMPSPVGEQDASAGSAQSTAHITRRFIIEFFIFAAPFFVSVPVCGVCRSGTVCEDYIIQARPTECSFL